MVSPLACEISGSVVFDALMILKSLAGIMANHL